MSPQALAAGRLARLLDQVVEQSRDVDVRAFHLGKQGGWRKLPADLAGLPGVSLTRPGPQAEEPVWLRVERLTPLPPPALHDAKLAGLIRIPDQPTGPAPTLDEALLHKRLQLSVAGKTAEEAKAFETKVALWVGAGLANYLALWQPWAHAEQARRRSIALYAELFELRQQLEATQTTQPLELVWGLGVAAWQLSLPPSGNPPAEPERVAVQYPLFSQAMEIALEDDSLALLLRPRAVVARPEFDPWAAARLPGSAELEQSLAASLAAAGPGGLHPLDTAAQEPLLRLVAGTLDPQGCLAPCPPDTPVSSAQLPAPGEHLVVSDAWVLLTRPRSNHYLHEDIRRLKARLAEAQRLPEGALALVTPPADALSTAPARRMRGRAGFTRPTSGTGGGPVHELYFPLPYNSEQVSIVEQLEQAAGVAVQGPPGTGKTHTIANIICHYLANGRRVLVTAKGDKALEVLQAKIPEAVRPLTVALLAGDREGLRQFQAALEAITHTIGQLNPPEVRERIASLHSDIHRAHQELVRIDQRIDAIAQTQLCEHTVEGQALRPQEMALRVARSPERHAWLDDRPTLAPAHNAPLDAMDTAKLREVRRLLGPDLPRVAAGLPDIRALPTPEDVPGLHQALQALHRLATDQAQGELPALASPEPATLEAARQLHQHLAQALPQVQALEAAAERWPQALRQRCAQPELASERAALDELLPEMDALVRERTEFLKRPVELPAADAHWPAVREAMLRAASTGKPLGLVAGWLGGEVKARLAAVRVAGLAPLQASDWAHAARFVQLHDRALSFVARWNAIAEALGLPPLEGGLATLRQIDRLAAGLRPACLLALHLDAPLPERLRQVFANPPRLPASPGTAELAHLMAQLRRHLGAAELTRAAARVQALRQRFAQPGEHPLLLALHRWLDDSLGQPEVSTELAQARHAELLAAWRQLDGLTPAWATLQTLAQRIALAGAPRWAERLLTQPAARAGDDPLVPADWPEAWLCARLRQHLESVEAHDELRTLAHQRQQVEATLARRYEEVVAQSAWLATRLGATPKVLAALAQYQTAVRLIGKGTGVNAARYRRDAQAAMQDAQAAVPCWIMNHAKVSEMLPAELGAFDLVIVDEASQSDVWALPAVLRGQRMLVVGDDKQVSPEVGFVSAARVQELRERFLADQPHAAVLTPTHSLYDTASSVFAAHKVMLREHFRCVAPIIEYSNRTFYKGYIQPLRLPTAEERLDPPLIDLYVPSGRRDGRDLNHAEAQAIADEIGAVLADPRCAGRSIGVISLLGAEQARHIDQRVRSRFDAGELLRRRFECGDARQFQGSERDIVFLSLVVSPGDCKALSGNVFEQRFNVAASRARDRLVLVRSVQLAELSPADLRLSLLAHFQPEQPVPASTAGSTTGTPAQGAGHPGAPGQPEGAEPPWPTDPAARREALLALCESGFEREVLEALLAAGYTVRPQVRVGSYRIDLVVEGAHGRRLAVECDGDEFHGPDRWAADMARQRVLERAGWRFWRCFASTWNRRRQAAWQDLQATLAAHDIAPQPDAAPAPAAHPAVAHRVWAGDLKA